MLRVCQYNTSSAVFFIISYFGFGFTSAYNSILFCGLRRNVEPCCHTHDSRSTMTVYSARPRLVGLALYTLTDYRDCLQRVALGFPIPAINKNHAAKCSSYRSQSQIFVENRGFGLPHLDSTSRLGGFPVGILPCRVVLKKQNGLVPDGEKDGDTITRFDRIHERDVFTRLVTNKRTDGRRGSKHCASARSKLAQA